MDNNFDEHTFHKQIAMYNTGLAVLLTIGGALFAAGIAFLTTGAVEVNHGIDLQGKSQDRILTMAFRFVGLGAEIFVLGLLIIVVSATVFPLILKRIPVPAKYEIERSENMQQSDLPVLPQTNQLEDEIKNIQIRAEIETLKVELANLKLEVATSKLEQIKNKTITKNRNAGRTNIKSKRN